MKSLRLFVALVSVVIWAAGSVPVVRGWDGEADDVDQSPLGGVQLVKSFPNLKLRRPVCITHAGDGSNRVFVVSEHGQILAFPNDQAVTPEQVTTFLDIEPKVDYEDKENEEGFLGLAFHPKFKENGELFIYYTIKNPPHTSIVSRVRVAKGDPSKADPATEEVLLTIPQPYWNHNGGNLAFGPDGYLYIGLGDGGAGGDPQGNGQNLKTLLGSILRIDVDHKNAGKAYAVPKDNPFVGREGAQPEIYAYGLRNVWGMSFDKETGLFWAADVGQNLWEEIDLIVKGGNYGWNVREGKFSFQPRGNQRRSEFIEPIWNYHHDLGRSITGGAVYRGQRMPNVVGYYLYADYVSGKVWGLKYDEQQKKVLANKRIEAAPNMPFMAIGEDEQRELHFADSFGNLWWLAKPEKKQ